MICVHAHARGTLTATRASISVVYASMATVMLTHVAVVMASEVHEAVVMAVTRAEVVTWHDGVGMRLKEARWAEVC